MIYQLPTGKIVHLSLEEYLNLTNEDIQYLISTGLGESPNNPFYSSSLSNPKGTLDRVIEHDTSMDYEDDIDDIDTDYPIDLDNLPDQ